LAGKGWGNDPCSPRVPFRQLEGSEEVPAAVLGGALHPWPPLPRFLRGDRLRSWSGGRGRCRGVAGRQRCAQEWGRGAHGGAARARHACGLCGWRVATAGTCRPRVDDACSRRGTRADVLGLAPRAEKPRRDRCGAATPWRARARESTITRRRLFHSDRFKNCITFKIVN
jgi:hypothetical protein